MKLTIRFNYTAIKVNDISMKTVGLSGLNSNVKKCVLVFGRKSTEHL